MRITSEKIKFTAQECSFVMTHCLICAWTLKGISTSRSAQFLRCLYKRELMLHTPATASPVVLLLSERVLLLEKLSFSTRMLKACSL